MLSVISEYLKLSIITHQKSEYNEVIFTKGCKYRIVPSKLIIVIDKIVVIPNADEDKTPLNKDKII
jgi:hypothetical protein